MKWRKNTGDAINIYPGRVLFLWAGVAKPGYGASLENWFSLESMGSNPIPGAIIHSYNDIETLIDETGWFKAAFRDPSNDFQLEGCPENPII